MAGLDFVPVVGTLIDLYNFVDDPNLETLGKLGISVASDFAGPFKGVVKAGAKPIFHTLLKTMSNKNARHAINAAIGFGKGSKIADPVINGLQFKDKFTNENNQ